MNISEFCERYRIPRAKARRIQRDNPAWFEPENGALEAIRFALANGDALSAAQLVELIEHPALMDELGAFEERAEKQLAALGRPIEPAPREIAAVIGEAAKNRDEAMPPMLRWLREIIPPRPVAHAYIGARLLLGVPANIRSQDVPKIPRVLINCRKRPELAGWWRIEKRGSRSVTIYQRPKKALAQFDL